MANLKLYAQGGDERAQKTLSRIESKLGFLPESYSILARSGNFLDAVLNVEQAAGNNLDEKTRQLIAVAVSAANGCSYCLHAHRALALKAGAKEEEVTGAVEVAAMMGIFNTFNKASNLKHDVTPEALKVGKEF